MSKHYYAEGAIHNDQHREFHVEAPMKSDDILKLAKGFFADDDVEDAVVVEEKNTMENLMASVLPSTQEIIMADFKDYVQKVEPLGFFRLPKVQMLNQQQQVRLIQKMQVSEKALCFALAQELDWYKYIEDQIPGYQKAKDRIAAFVQIFGVGERQAAGYINALKENSTEDTDRYNTKAYLKDAKEFYEALLSM